MEDYNLRKHQLIELKMLITVVEICERHNIQYFMMDGTLLGAVRHQGFIPWDDDIDIAMLRNDYEKFLAVAQSELSAQYFLQTYQTDSEYPLGYAKIRDNETQFLEKSVCHLNINHGVYIDVFPLDGVASCGFIENTRRKIMILIESAIWKHANPTIGQINNRLGNFISNVLCWCLSQKKLRLLVDKLLRYYQCEKQEFIASYFGAYGVRAIVPSCVFRSDVILNFEGNEVKAPVGYNAYLESVYGNYMELPPVEKRIAHHNAVAVSLNSR